MATAKYILVNISDSILNMLFFICLSITMFVIPHKEVVPTSDEASEANRRSVEAEKFDFSPVYNQPLMKANRNVNTIFINQEQINSNTDSIYNNSKQIKHIKF